MTQEDVLDAFFPTADDEQRRRMRENLAKLRRAPDEQSPDPPF